MPGPAYRDTELSGTRKGKTDPKQTIVLGSELCRDKVMHKGLDCQEEGTSIFGWQEAFMEGQTSSPSQ